VDRKVLMILHCCCWRYYLSFLRVPVFEAVVVWSDPAERRHTEGASTSCGVLGRGASERQEMCHWGYPNAVHGTPPASLELVP